MKVIKVLDILLEYLLALAFAVCIVAGVFNWRFFMAAGLILVIYIIWGAWRLRCPWCRSTVELRQLLRGCRRGCNCPNCGHEITVVWRVREKLPRKLRRDRE